MRIQHILLSVIINNNEAFKFNLSAVSSISFQESSILQSRSRSVDSLDVVVQRSLCSIHNIKINKRKNGFGTFIFSFFPQMTPQMNNCISVSFYIFPVWIVAPEFKFLWFPRWTVPSETPGATSCIVIMSSAFHRSNNK